MIKRFLVKDWLPKLLCLILAIGVWYVIQETMERDGSTATPYDPDIRRSHP